MRTIVIVSQMFFIVFLLVVAGCQWPLIPPASSAETNDDFNKLSIYTRYSPARISILPLTELISSVGARQAEINLYVSLLDSLGTQIKSPCIFRFELYQRVQRSAEPKGKRIIIWPDIDLSDPVINNEYWQDFLRAYEFYLPFEPVASQSYILQVTCMCPNSRRLSAEFALKLPE